MPGALPKRGASLRSIRFATGRKRFVTGCDQVTDLVDFCSSWFNGLRFNGLRFNGLRFNGFYMVFEGSY